MVGSAGCIMCFSVLILRVLDTLTSQTTECSEHFIHTSRTYWSSLPSVVNSRLFFYLVLQHSLVILDLRSYECRFCCFLARVCLQALGLVPSASPVSNAASAPQVHLLQQHHRRAAARGDRSEAPRPGRHPAGHRRQWRRRLL